MYYNNTEEGLVVRLMNRNEYNVYLFIFQNCPTTDMKIIVILRLVQVFFFYNSDCYLGTSSCRTSLNPQSQSWLCQN